VTGIDPAHMVAALALAQRGLGQVWPNPAVGCVIAEPGDRGGRVLGRGFTQMGGRPHAETKALAQAGAAAKGAVAYVTLEPCAHHGQTPPCAEALAHAGVARVVAAMIDPDPRVAGRGLACLEAAGIGTEVGLMAEAAARLNQGFVLRVAEGRPLVTLKLAMSLDGRIAMADGESKWITGEAARLRGHLLRARSDAIMIGAETARADDPELTCRLPGFAGKQPVAIVLDSHLRLDPTSRLANGARERPVWVVTGPAAAIERRRALEERGVEVLEVGLGAAGRPDVAAALDALARRGLTRILCEGGARLAASLLEARLVDRLALFRGGQVIGSGGRAAIEALAPRSLAEAHGFVRRRSEILGPDMLEEFDVARGARRD
jgi:diaminohydroxyphosphoribosylaminopyrimidine deaminase / 5-amino-6-(5-phosphoribosylamino)uracil reductase